MRKKMITLLISNILKQTNKLKIFLLQPANCRDQTVKTNDFFEFHPDIYYMHTYTSLHPKRKYKYSKI